MNKIYFLLVAALITSTSALANSGLQLLQGKKWKGDCRKVVNEAGDELKNRPYERLQSSYTVINDRLIWWVKAFSDTSCTQIQSGHKYTFGCAATERPVAYCIQSSLEESTNGTTWERIPMLDHAGYPNVTKMEVNVKPMSKSLRIFVRSEEGDERSEILK